jgi:nicotinate-nucleotide pyrophosphorylase (carboxylating)
MAPGGSPVDASMELREAFANAIAAALEEDLGTDALDLDADVTTHAVVPVNQWGRATVYAKQDGVVCGLAALKFTYGSLDRRVDVKQHHKDGDAVAPGDVVAEVRGPVRAVLVGERTALNIASHLSGIATMVREFVRAAPGVELSDTRKTLPGLRRLQKYAVRVGGGANHRYALWDGVLVKDNHIVAAGGVGEAVRRARASSALPVQAECTSLEEVDEALDAGAVAFLLDNQSSGDLAKLVTRIREQRDFAMIEASGGVTLANVAEVAASGVDRISVGAFTHSAQALDLSMKLEEVWEGEEA